MKPKKFVILFFILTLIKNTVQKRHPKNFRKLKVIKRKTKKEENKIRNLMADVIMKVKEKLGVKTFTHHHFKEVIGGITNIKMAKENPFVVVNTYPINQYMLPGPKESIDLSNSYTNKRLI